MQSVRVADLLRCVSHIFWGGSPAHDSDPDPDPARGLPRPDQPRSRPRPRTDPTDSDTRPSPTQTRLTATSPDPDPTPAPTPTHPQEPGTRPRHDGPNWAPRKLISTVGGKIPPCCGQLAPGKQISPAGHATTTYSGTGPGKQVSTAGHTTTSHWGELGPGNTNLHNQTRDHTVLAGGWACEKHSGRLDRDLPETTGRGGANNSRRQDRDVLGRATGPR